MDLENKVQKPEIRNQTAFQKAQRKPHPDMDKISINQNVFIELTDKKSGTDLTILPAEVNWNFLARWREGHSYKYGQTSELKSEFGGVDVNIKECQVVDKKYQLDYDPSKASVAKQDDDDFDDDDTTGEKLKPSAVAGLICSVQPQLQRVIGDMFKEMLTEILSWQEHGMVLGFLA